MTSPELQPHAPRYGWFQLVRDLTLQLVAIRSVSPDVGETLLSAEVMRLLCQDDLADRYTEVGLDPLEHDPYQRSNAYALLQGASKRTIILLGHIDTVDTADYGELEPWALDPPELAKRHSQLSGFVPDLATDRNQYPGDWMFGRGVVDMKSGVATNIAVLRRLAEEGRETPLPVSILLLATPDEENESAGVLQAVRFLLRLKERHGLEYIGAINTDYTTSLYSEDPHRYIYTGTVGKLLPSFFIVGRESHAGAPYDGLDANLIAAELIRDLSMGEELCDTVRGQITPPPVTLHAGDLKQHYDVQIPFTAHFYLNVLTFTTRPDELLQRLTYQAEASLARVLQRVDESERRWLVAGNARERALRLLPRAGVVMTYESLRLQAESLRGQAAVREALAEEWGRLPEGADKRLRSLAQVQRLWSISGLSGPAVIIYYSPPFYPHVKASPCALHAAVARVAERHPEIPLIEREYFPFLSDMSYLRLDPEIETTSLIRNMPVWQSPDGPTSPGAYTLPLEAIRRLDLPVVNLGPYGQGAHQRGERVLMSYSFDILPQLVYETVKELASDDDR
jgi:arginine utilization protein RocB